MNICKFCQKEVKYPEGLYLKGGKEVHVNCLIEKRKELSEYLKTKENLSK
jgi:hypothetical protein